MALGRAQLPNVPNLNLSGYVQAPQPSMIEQILGQAAQQLVSNVVSNVSTKDYTNEAVAQGLLGETEKRGKFGFMRDPLDAKEFNALRQSKDDPVTSQIRQAQLDKLNSEALDRADPTRAVAREVAAYKARMDAMKETNDPSTSAEPDPVAAAQLAAGSDPRRGKLSPSFAATLFDSINTVGNINTLGLQPESVNAKFADTAGKANLMASAGDAVQEADNFRRATGPGQGLMSALGDAFRPGEGSLADIVTGRYKGGQDPEAYMTGLDRTDIEKAVIQQIANGPQKSGADVLNRVQQQSEATNLLMQQLGLDTEGYTAPVEEAESPDAAFGDKTSVIMELMKRLAL